jgi:hypothetical protein
VCLFSCPTAPLVGECPASDMPRVKAAPTRRADGAIDDVVGGPANGGLAASAHVNSNEAAGRAPPAQSAHSGVAPAGSAAVAPITLRVRHAGGMSRVEVDAARCTVASLKGVIADLDSVLADPDKMLLYKEGVLTDCLTDADTLHTAGLGHGSIVHMRLSKPRAPPTKAAAALATGGGAGARTAAAAGGGARGGGGGSGGGNADVNTKRRKHDDGDGASCATQRRHSKKTKPTLLAHGWSADTVASTIVYAAGGGAGGSSGHAQRTADQFSQAHRIEAVEKGQLNVTDVAGRPGERCVTFTHRHRDPEVCANSACAFRCRPPTHLLVHF